MFSTLDQEVKAPEIHRNTPFEFALTAEPQQIVEKSAQPVQFASSRITKLVVVKLIPRLPKWIASSLAEEE